MQANLTFDKFADIMRAVARQGGEQSVITGLDQNGRAYSMTEDDALDSLDSVELVMSLEEAIKTHLNLPEFEIPQDELEKANNAGDIYEIVCREVGAVPVYEPA